MKAMMRNPLRREVLYLFFRFQWLVWTLLGAGLVVSLGCYAFQPREYEAVAKVLVKLGREKTSLNPAAQSESFLSVNLRPEDINTEIEIITSPDLLHELVARRGIADWAKPNRAPDLELQMLQAAERLRKKLVVKQSLHTDILVLKYRSVSADRAAAVLNQLLDLYLDQRAQVHSPRSLLDLFSRQEAQAREQLDQIDRKIRRFSAGTKPSAASRSGFVSHQILGLPYSDSIRYMERKLAELENRHRRLRQADVRQDRPPADLDAQIEAIRSRLEAERAQYRAQEQTFNEWIRQKRDAETLSGLYKKKTDEARVFETADPNKVVSVHILARATPPLHPVGTGLPGRVVLALGIALIAALFLLVLLHFSDVTFRDEEQVEKALGLPVAASIPHLSAAPARVLAERKRLALRHWVQHFLSAPDLAGKRILVIAAPLPHSGTSTVAKEFAQHLAFESGRTILLLDSHLPAPGTISSALDQERPLEIKKMTETVHVLTLSTAAGGYLHKSKWLANRLNQLEKDYTYIVVDAVPILTNPDFMLWLTRAQGLYLLIQAEKTRQPVAQRALEVLRRYSTPVLGVVLNRRRYPIPEPIYRWLYK